MVTHVGMAISDNAGIRPEMRRAVGELIDELDRLPHDGPED